MTRRRWLAILSLTSDKLGLVSPFLLIGRLKMHELCKKNQRLNNLIQRDIMY